MRSCGGCYACRINKRRVWTGRILLESYFYPETSFVTLTYEDSHIPQIDGLQVLDKSHFKRFIREFGRTSFGPNFRWYGVGEYGDESMRPHYHFILFGVGVGWRNEIAYAWSEKIDKDHVTSKMVRDGRVLADGTKFRQMFGHITMEPLIAERAAYACGYVVKKMSASDDTRLKGRPPEFRSMSKQYGGIGISGLGWLADMQMTNAGSKALAQRCDVFDSIRVEGKIWPIGDYLRNELRKLMGVPTNYDERLAQLGEYKYGEQPFAPPFDLAEVRSLPSNRRLIDAKKIEVAPTALSRIEAIERKRQRSARGAKI